MDDFIRSPEGALMKWRGWYDARKEHLLSSEQHKYFVKIYEVLRQMSSYDRQILTEKFFNLKDIDTSSFNVRSQKDSELAKKFKVTVKTIREQRVRAIDEFKRVWKQVEIDKQVFVVGELAIKTKIITATEYELTYLHFETNEIVKTDIIKIDSKGEI